MTPDAWQLTGKTLPTFFGQGYITAIYGLFGLSATQAIIRLGARKVTQQATDTTFWTEPLEACIKQPIGCRPFDYAYIAIPHYGIAGWLNPEKVPIFSKRIGRSWWNPESPIHSTFWEKNRLYDVISPLIIQTLRDLFIETTKESDFQAQIIRQYFAAFKTFGNFMNNKAGINCEVSGQGSRVELLFPVCPFCLNQTTDCRVFHGIVEGVLAWLNGVEASDTGRLRHVVIDQEVSDAHHLILQGPH